MSYIPCPLRFLKSRHVIRDAKIDETYAWSQVVLVMQAVAHISSPGGLACWLAVIH